MNADKTPNIAATPTEQLAGSVEPRPNPVYRGQISEHVYGNGIPSQSWQTIWMGIREPGLNDLRSAAPHAGKLEEHGPMLIDVTSTVRIQRRRQLLGRFAAGWKTVAEMDLFR